MKTLLNDEKRNHFSNKDYSSWRNELNTIADAVQERAMMRLLQLEGKNTTKKYKLQPTIPAVDKRLTSIGESKWNSVETSKASTMVLQSYFKK